MELTLGKKEGHEGENNDKLPVLSSDHDPLSTGEMDLSWLDLEGDEEIDPADWTPEAITKAKTEVANDPALNALKKKYQADQARAAEIAKKAAGTHHEIVKRLPWNIDIDEEGSRAA